jgi:hypothetical protein
VPRVNPPVLAQVSQAYFRGATSRGARP